MVSICSTSTENNLAAKKFIEEMNKDEVKASSTVAFEGPMPEVGAVFRDVEIKGKFIWASFSLPPSLLPFLLPFCDLSRCLQSSDEYKSFLFTHLLLLLPSLPPSLPPSGIQSFGVFVEILPGLPRANAHLIAEQRIEVNASFLTLSLLPSLPPFLL